MLTRLDEWIVMGYLLATVLIGFRAARKRRSSDDFFVARRTLPWWVVGLSMIAASISAEQMLGEVGYSLDAGLVVSNWDLAVFPSLALMVLIFLPIYLDSGITTIPEYLERRYNKGTRLWFAAYTVFNNAGVTLVMVLALGATALRYFLGINAVWAVAALAVFTGIYTVLGGMSSVAWTDTFQCVLLLAGGLIVFAAGLEHVPGGWSGLLDRMPAPHLIRPVTDPSLPWPGLLLLTLSTNVWYCATNQFYVQAGLGAKDKWHGQMGVLLTAFMGPVLTLCCAFPGYIGHDLLEQGLLPPLPAGAGGGPDVNATLPHLVANFVGPGWRGLVVAGVVAAVMSTISSVVNATAAVFTVDLYQSRWRTKAGGAELVRVGRWAGTVTLGVAAPLSLVALRHKYIFIYSQNAWCILAIPIMLAFTLGMCWKRTTAPAASLAFLFTLPFVAVPFVMGDNSFLKIPWLGVRVHLFTFAFGLWILEFLIMIGVSLASIPPEAQKIQGLVWSPKKGSGAKDSARPWPRRAGAWTLLAGLVYALIYWRFW